MTVIRTPRSALRPWLPAQRARAHAQRGTRRVASGARLLLHAAAGGRRCRRDVVQARKKTSVAGTVATRPSPGLSRPSIRASEVARAGSGCGLRHRIDGPVRRQAAIASSLRHVQRLGCKNGHEPSTGHSEG